MFCPCDGSIIHQTVSPGIIPPYANMPDKIEYTVSAGDEGDVDDPNTQLFFQSLQGYRCFVFFNNQVVPETMAKVENVETYNWNAEAGILTKFHGFRKDESIILIPYKKY